MSDDPEITADEFLSGPEQDEPPPAPPDGLLSPTRTLAREALEAALPPPAMRRFLLEARLAVLIRVPSATWVRPVAEAARAMAAWTTVFKRDGSDKFHHKSELGSDDVARDLGRGGRVLGVSHDPVRYLPTALVAVADLRVTIVGADDRIVRRVIRAATGSAPRRMPPGLGAGLGYAELCASIRAGSTPGACVRRLLAVRGAGAGLDPLVASAPPLAQMHGFGEAMAWCVSLLQDIAAWQRGEIALTAVDRACVWAGEPGVGKTALARSLAKSGGLPLIATSVSDWFAGSPGYLDSVVKAADLAFTQAEAAASQRGRPALLFLDELDAIPDRRGLSDRNREWWSTLVAHLLLRIEAVLSSERPLIIVGATNFGDRIDPALIRPGRLGRIIVIPRPDARALAGILRTHLADDLAGEDLSGLAALGEGATGAQAAAWVRAARRIARRAGRAMALADLRAVIAPPDMRPPEVVRRTAVHEAGHAVAIRVTGAGSVKRISILEAGDSGGHTARHPPPDPSPPRDVLEKLVVITLAGRAAEEVALGVPTSGAQRDLAVATELLCAIHVSLGLGDSLLHRAGSDEASRLLDGDAKLRLLVEADLRRLYDEAVALVREHEFLVQRLADVLVADRQITGADFERLYAAYAKTRAARLQGGGHG